MNTAPNTENAVNCGNCDGLFRLPQGISGKATIQCPHCDTEVKVSDLFAQLPIAKVCRDAGNEDESATSSDAELAPVQRSRYAIDEQSYSIPKPLKTALRRHHHHRASSDKNPSPGQTPKSTKREPFGRKKSTTMDIVKMALGGLVAIPIAQIILWWFFSVDPFQMVDRVYPYFPSIVPQALAPVDGDADSGKSNEANHEL